MKSIPPCRPTRRGEGGGLAVSPRAQAGESTETEVQVEADAETGIEEAFARVWNVLVWNDPINTMTYVTFVFQKVLKMDRATAERHMLEVHHKGKSIVAGENREKAEFFVHQLQSFGLKATMERA